MIQKSEQLLETLINLEQSRQREQKLRIESEALLEGLRGISIVRESKIVLNNLVNALHSVIPFEDAFIIKMQKNNSMIPIYSTSDKFLKSVWKPQSAFNRSLKGRPVAVYDVNLIPEWVTQPNAVKDNIKSALHFGLSDGKEKLLFIITHSTPKHFNPNHVNQAIRFSHLALQAFITIDLQQKVIQRDRFFQLSTDFMVIFSYKGDIQQINHAWVKHIGYTLEELIHKKIFELFLVEDQQHFQRVIEEINEQGKTRILECRLPCKNGKVLWLSCSIAAYPEEELCYLVARDITEIAEARKQLEFQAYHDPLTNLCNRKRFMERLKLSYATNKRRPEYKYAILYLDIDNFKDVNDNFGHNIGDQLLIRISKNLLSIVREVDVVARFGGDEFVILLNDINNSNNPEIVIKRILSKLSQPIIIEDHETKISTSIGITSNVFKYNNLDQMIIDADQAMYMAKKAGKSQYKFFKPAPKK